MVWRLLARKRFRLKISCFKACTVFFVPRMYCNRGKCTPECAAVRPLSARAFYIELFRIFARYRLCLRHGLELSIPNRSEAPGGNLGDIETLASIWFFARLRRRRYKKREREGERERKEKSQIVSIFLRSSFEAKIYFFTSRELYFAQEKARETRLNSRYNSRRKRECDKAFTVDSSAE